MPLHKTLSYTYANRLQKQLGVKVRTNVQKVQERLDGLCSFS